MMDRNPSPPARLSLPEITLCAADSIFVDLTARALTVSMAECDFGDAILFSDAAKEGPFRNVKIDPLMSTKDYSRFCLYDLADFVDTPFALIVQWDGYVVNAAAWKRAFQKYDYVGAPWHGRFGDDRIVGNGGFSLRSRRLMQATRTLPPAGGFAEDLVICRIFGRQLERDFGLRFAPTKIADQFSYELRPPTGPTFGFHGVQRLARHCSDEELVGIADSIVFDRVNPNKIVDLIIACAREGRTRSGRALSRRLFRIHPPVIVKRVLGDRIGRIAGEAQFAVIEALLSGGD